MFVLLKQFSPSDKLVKFNMVISPFQKEKNKEKGEILHNITPYIFKNVKDNYS